MPAVLPLAIVTFSGIVYHLAQKASGAVRPWPMLAIAYGSAFALTLVMMLSGRDGERWPLGRGEYTAGLLLGLAVLGIEGGFFFIYRAGWPLASASVITNIAVTAILAVVGVIGFGEHLSAGRVVGLALAVAGAALIARG